MIKGTDFTVSHASVSIIKYLQIIIDIELTKGVIIFISNISNEFHNTILNNPQEHILLSLPDLYLEWFRWKYHWRLLSSHEEKYLCNNTINYTQGIKLSGNLCFVILKPIFSTVNIICSCSDHTVLYWYQNHQKSLPKLKWMQLSLVPSIYGNVGLLQVQTECALPERDIARKECCASSYERKDEVRARAGARSAKVGWRVNTMGYIPEISTYIISS